MLAVLVGCLVRDVGEKPQVRCIARRDADILDRLVLLAVRLCTDVLGLTNFGSTGVILCVHGGTDELDVVARSRDRSHQDAAVQDGMQDVPRVPLDDETEVIHGDVVHLHRVE